MGNLLVCGRRLGDGPRGDTYTSGCVPMRLVTCRTTHDAAPSPHSIDVDIGAGSQVGTLSLVPKHTTLEAQTVYAGIPVRRMQPSAPDPSQLL